MTDTVEEHIADLTGVANWAFENTNELIKAAVRVDDTQLKMQLLVVDAIHKSMVARANVALPLYSSTFFDDITSEEHRLTFAQCLKELRAHTRRLETMTKNTCGVIRWDTCFDKHPSANA